LDPAAFDTARRMVSADGIYFSHSLWRPDPNGALPEEHDDGGGLLDPREGRAPGLGFDGKFSLAKGL
jgi:hypothetical protein